MDMKTVQGFIKYYERTRETTKRAIAVIPPDQLDFSYMEGKFTFGDLVRHIAAVERHIFAQIADGKAPNYKGCGKELADGYDNVVAYFDRMHEESMAIFSKLSDEDLNRKVVTMSGLETDLGNFLRAMLVHEIHHRGALHIYLNLVGVKAPAIFGITEEQLIENSK